MFRTNRSFICADLRPHKQQAPALYVRGLVFIHRNSILTQILLREIGNYRCLKFRKEDTENWTSPPVAMLPPSSITSCY